LTGEEFNPIISDITKLYVLRGENMADFHYREMQAPSLSELGRIIREKRRASALRIDDAAALCGVSVDLLSRLENGKSGVSTDRVLRVLDGLGLAMLVVDKEKVAQLLAAANMGGR
jgi:plasmid maintenance system antidote protein VapI